MAVQVRAATRLRQPCPTAASPSWSTMTNRHGMEVRILTSAPPSRPCIVPDRRGQACRCRAGLRHARRICRRHNISASTVGRVANRIADGRFTLDGRTYACRPITDPMRCTAAPRASTRRTGRCRGDEGRARASVTLRHVSPDGDQGFPGTLEVTATYRSTTTNSLSVDYSRPQTRRRSSTSPATLIGRSAAKARPRGRWGIC